MARRAPKVDNFIGQKKHVNVLRRLLEGAQAHKEPFPHTLLLGPSGVGKTLLAKSLADWFGTHLIEGMSHDRRATLSRRLLKLRPNDFFLIDECHFLDPYVQELLYQAIDRKSIPDPDRKASKRKANGDGRRSLPPWTLILATDQPGRLRNALHERMVHEVSLDYYPTKELREIVAALAADLKILLKTQAVTLIAEVACGLPRRAKLLLQKLRLFDSNAGQKPLGVEDIRRYLEAMETDETGLGSMDYRYMEAVAALEGASLESLALRLGIDKAYVRHQIEPMLARRALVKITSAGRQLTPTGRGLVEEYRKNNQERTDVEDEADEG